MVAEVAKQELCLVKTVGSRGIARRHTLHEAEQIRRLGSGLVIRKSEGHVARLFGEGDTRLSLAGVDVAASGCEQFSEFVYSNFGHAGLAYLHCMLPSVRERPICSVIQQIGVIRSKSQ